MDPWVIPDFNNTDDIVTVQTKIEDPLANEVLEGRIHQGDLISVQMKNKQVHFTVKKG